MTNRWGKRRGVKRVRAGYKIRSEGVAVSPIQINNGRVLPKENLTPPDVLPRLIASREKLH